MAREQEEALNVSAIGAAKILIVHLHQLGLEGRLVGSNPRGDPFGRRQESSTRRRAEARGPQQVSISPSQSSSGMIFVAPGGGSGFPIWAGLARSTARAFSETKERIAVRSLPFDQGRTHLPLKCG
jgi:hypothetical protein